MDMVTPSIGDLKRNGAIGLVAICRRGACGHRLRIAFHDLQVADDAVFGGLTTGGRVCLACGRGQLTLAPDW